MTDAKMIAGKLLEIRAIKMSPENPFTWASGWKSPIYCDNRMVLSFPDVRKLVRDGLCQLVSKKFPNADLLAGVATAGIAWGAMAADHLNLPFIYVRPKPKEHGLGNQIEGYFVPGQGVVVIEDLISTGKSSLLVAKILQENGLKVAGLVSVFSYGFTEATRNFDQAGLPFYSLTSYDALLDLALERNFIRDDQIAILQNWRNDPVNWGKGTS